MNELIQKKLTKNDLKENIIKEVQVSKDERYKLNSLEADINVVKEFMLPVSNKYNAHLSDKNIAAITKTYDGKTTLLVFNLSQETQKVDISGVDLGGEGTIGGMLLTGEDTITLDNNELTLPSYSMALIAVE